MSKKDKILIAVAVLVSAVAGAATYFRLPAVLLFILAAAALILVAMIVGKATEQLGSRMGPAATGVLQSALGNLPELFVCIFALRAGLYKVVKAALVGSIFGNSVFVLGMAILVGGLKNGRQKFHSEPPKTNAILMILAFAAMAVPTLTYYLHTPAESHLDMVDIVVAVVLLLMFSSYLIFSIKGDKSTTPEHAADPSEKSWSLVLTLIVLAAAGVAAGFVSDWFVDALQPAMATLEINDVFAGLIVVALAGNAIENLVGIQLSFKNKADYAVSVIMNSSLQVAMVLYPLLIILSFFIGGAVLSFVLSPLLLAALALSVLVRSFIVFDGESIWLEGVALIGLYIIIAAAFWWG